MKTIITPYLKNSLAVAFVGILILVSSGFAAREILGGYSGFVERMGAGTRELGRGNTGVGDIDAGAEAFWNPAILSLKSGVRVSVDGERGQLDRTGGALSVSSRIGSRMGMGVSALYRGDRDFQVVNSDDEDIGTSKPTFINTYVGLSWRLNPKQALGMSFGFAFDNLDMEEALSEEDIDFNDKNSSGALLNLSWFSKINERFDYGVVIRNIGFNKNLTARYNRTMSSDNSTPSSEEFFPKSLEIGVTYHTEILGKPFDMSCQIINYQLADTLLVFDPDYHIQSGRMGLDWEIIPKGNVRLGFDDKSWAIGLGYEFELKFKKIKLPLAVDYALKLERNVYSLNPFSLGLRTSF